MALLAAMALCRLLPAIVKHIESADKITVEFSKMQVTMQKVQSGLGEMQETYIVEKGCTEPQKHPTTRRLAWVDDNPENNTYEIEHLEEHGVDVLKIESTSDAIAKLVHQGQEVDVIITDLGRTEGRNYNSTAGLDLITALRRNNITKPVYVYTSSEKARDLRDRIIDLGGTDTTGNQLKLFEFLRIEGLLYR